MLRVTLLDGEYLECLFLAVMVVDGLRQRRGHGVFTTQQADRSCLDQVTGKRPGEGQLYPMVVPFRAEVPGVSGGKVLFAEFIFFGVGAFMSTVPETIVMVTGIVMAAIGALGIIFSSLRKEWRAKIVVPFTRTWQAWKDRKPRKIFMARGLEIIKESREVAARAVKDPNCMPNLRRCVNHLKHLVLEPCRIPVPELLMCRRHDSMMWYQLLRDYLVKLEECAGKGGLETAEKLGSSINQYLLITVTGITEE